MRRVLIRLAIPPLLFFVIVETALVLWHYHAADRTRRTIEFLAVLIGAGTAIYSVLLGVHTTRGAAAGRFMERWNDPSFAETRKKLGQIIEKAKGGQPVDQSDRAAVVSA